MLADRYLRLATSEFAGYSALYEGLALAMAADPEALALVEPLGDPNQTPVRLFACVHDLTLAEPGLPLSEHYRWFAAAPDVDPDAVMARVWPSFRALLFERTDELVAAMSTRTIQTNEVGRVGALIPALTEIVASFRAPAVGQEGGRLGEATVDRATGRRGLERKDVGRQDVERRVNLVEIGPSAGLNLFVDRYRVDYTDGRSTGPVDAPVVLRCEVLGPNRPPLPSTDRPLTIDGRVGIDIAPLDVTVADDRRWLEACVWPGLTERAQRLRDAMDLARTDPPVLHRGSALDLLGPVIATVPDDEVVVVVSTWVLAYFTKPDRVGLHDILDEIGAHRDLALVTAEYPQVVPWVPEPSRPPAAQEGKGATLLARTTWNGGLRTTRPLAWMQAHGLWLDWLDPPT